MIISGGGVVGSVRCSCRLEQTEKSWATSSLTARHFSLSLSELFRCLFQTDRRRDLCALAEVGQHGRGGIHFLISRPTAYFRSLILRRAASYTTPGSISIIHPAKLQYSTVQYRVMAEKSLNRTERLYYLSICVLMSGGISRHFTRVSNQFTGAFWGWKDWPRILFLLSSLCDTGQSETRNVDDTRERRGFFSVDRRNVQK
jgi:hypothetical protein